MGRLYLCPAFHLVGIMSEVVKPRSRFDKQLQKIAGERLWDAVPDCVRFLTEVVTSDKTYTVVKANGMSVEIPVYEIRDKLAAVKLILERTVPALQHIQQTNTNLNFNAPELDWADIHRRAVASAERIQENANGRDHRIH